MLCTRYAGHLSRKIFPFYLINCLQTEACKSLHLPCWSNMQISKQSLDCIWTSYQQSSFFFYIYWIFIKIFIKIKKTISNCIIQVEVCTSKREQVFKEYFCQDSAYHLIYYKKYDCWYNLTESAVHCRGLTYLFSNIFFCLPVKILVDTSESRNVTLLSFIGQYRKWNNSVCSFANNAHINSVAAIFHWESSFWEMKKS